VKEVDTKMPYDQAKAIVLESLQPLGKDYVETVRKGIDAGWVDVYENEGKRSGAFQWGTYGCHPYICLNYDNKINDLFTLAHEMGHAMHSHYTWGAQPYVYGDYTIFLAEVASTVNEALLMEHMLKTTTDQTMKEYLLNYFLEQFRGTLFRQVMFAEFEMLTHEMAANGEPLTSDSLSALYYDLNKKYYGDDIVVDDRIAYEWARIPHFYNAFYVYKYATGYSAAIAFSKRILAGGEELSQYFEFLKSGSSDYSIDILKKAGVDLSSPEPVREALQVFGELLDQMENQG
jgi:oligoendopeptidase F